MAKHVERKFWALWVVFAILLVVGSLFGGGCCPTKQARDEAKLSMARVSAYVALMEAGKTTREQDQDMIRASKTMFLALYHAMGGEDDAGTP